MNQSISDFNNILQRHIILSGPVKKKGHYAYKTPQIIVISWWKGKVHVAQRWPLLKPDSKLTSSVKHVKVKESNLRHKPCEYTAASMKNYSQRITLPGFFTEISSVIYPDLFRLLWMCCLWSFNWSPQQLCRSGNGGVETRAGGRWWDGCSDTAVIQYQTNTEGLPDIPRY